MILKTIKNQRYFFIVLLILISALIKETRELNKTSELSHHVWDSYPEKMSEYFKQFPGILNVKERANKFKEMLSNLFHYGNVTHPDKIHEQLDEFHHKIENYFRTFFPEEEKIFEAFDKFSNRILENLKNLNLTSDEGNLVIRKFYNFTGKNFSDFNEEEKAVYKNVTQKFDEFLERVDKYLSMDSGIDEFPSLKESETKPKISKDMEATNKTKQEPSYFVVYEHRVYVYDLNQKKCNSTQMDSCSLRCKELNKVLCGCYTKQKNGKDFIDCICADGLNECFTNHTHTEIDVNRKKISKDL
jgi:hypothetical protein